MDIRKIFYYLFGFIVSIYISIFLCFMPNEWFRDRDNYLIYAGSSDRIYESYIGYSIYFNEPIFLKLNQILSSIFQYDSIPHIFVFFISFTFFFNLIKCSKTSIMFLLGVILMLTIPYVIQSQLVALRQGIATALFMWGFLNIKNEKNLLLLILFCGFVHSIFFLIFVFYYLNFIAFKEVKLEKKMIFNLLGMIVFSVFSIAIAKFFGLRQGDEYTESFSRGGGGAFIIFLIIATYLYFYGEKNNKRLFEFSILGIILFLSAYFLTPIAGRFFNTIAPFIIFLLVQRSRLVDILFLVLLGLVFVILMVYSTYISLLVIPEFIFLKEFHNYFKEYFLL